MRMAALFLQGHFLPAILREDHMVIQNSLSLCFVWYSHAMDSQCSGNYQHAIRPSLHRVPPQPACCVRCKRTGDSRTRTILRFHIEQNCPYTIAWCRKWTPGTWGSITAPFCAGMQRGCLQIRPQNCRRNSKWNGVLPWKPQTYISIQRLGGMYYWDVNQWGKNSQMYSLTHAEKWSNPVSDWFK